MTEFRPARFQILPTIVKNIIIINVLVFLAQKTLGDKYPITDLFALHSFQSPLFKPWQFITYMFLHNTSSLWHIMGNMFAVWMFGSVLENLWGPKRFINFYIICGLGAALAHMIVLYFDNQRLISDFHQLQGGTVDYAEYVNFVRKYKVGPYTDPAILFSLRLNEATLGASGAVFGCLAAFGYLFPNTYIYLYFAIPIKAKWFVMLYAGFELYSTISASAGDNVAHLAHLGGAAVGFLLVYFWNKTNRKTFY